MKTIGFIASIGSILFLSVFLFLFKKEETRNTIPTFTTNMLQSITKLSLVEASESIVFKYTPESNYSWWDGKEIISHAVITAQMGYDTIVVSEIDTICKIVYLNLDSAKWNSISFRIEFISSSEGIATDLDEKDYNACKKQAEDLLTYQLSLKKEQCQAKTKEYALLYFQNLLYPAGYSIQTVNNK